MRGSQPTESRRKRVSLFSGLHALLGIFLTSFALSGIAISMAFGRWLDIRPSVAPVYLSLGLTTIGYILLTATTRFYLLLMIACGPLASSLAGFPQLFALAKSHLDRTSADGTQRGIASAHAQSSWIRGSLVFQHH